MNINVTFEEQSANMKANFGNVTVINTPAEGIPDESNCSQDTMYTFSFADLEGITIDRYPVMKRTTYKTSITTKDGLPANIPAVTHSIYLWTGIADLITEKVTPLFDLPMVYSLKSNTIENSSIRNLMYFTPYLSLPPLIEGYLSVDYLLDCVSSYTVHSKYRLLSNSLFIENNKKLMGIHLSVDMEFANTTIRDAFYDEFIPVLDQVTNLYLKYENYKAVECSYIGGNLDDVE
jgi:hypothetical protein